MKSVLIITQTLYNNIYDMTETTCDYKQN